MAKHVVTKAMMTCTMGTTPARFIATPKMVQSGNFDAGNIMDNKPLVNIRSFGPCKSPAFPATAAATTAALGVLTPMPCIPATPMPWAPGSPTVMTANIPSLQDTSCLTCIWGGLIKFSSPGQMTEDIP